MPSVGLAALEATGLKTAEAAAWLTSRRCEELLLRELDSKVAAALLADRRRLQRVLSEPDFMLAAALTSPSLASGAIRYVQLESTEPDKQTRKAEPKLARYAERALTKTSPFSHYTVAAFGRWGEIGSGRVDTRERAVRTVPNLLFVLRLLDAALTDPALASSVRFAVNSVANLTERGFEYELLKDDPDSSRLYRTARTRTTIPATGAVRLVVQAAGASDDGLTLAELADRLARAADPPMEVAATYRYVHRLWEVGLLVPRLTVREQDEQPALRLAEDLEAIAGEAAHRLAGQLRELHTSTVRIAELGGVERVAAVTALARAWSAAFAAWGADVPPGSPLFEDVVTTSPIAVDQARWAEVRADLANLLPALEPFSMDHPGSSLMRLKVIDKIGTGGRIPYPEFATLLRDIFTSEQVSIGAILREIGGRDPALLSLLELRDTFVQEMAEARPETREVVISDELVAAVAAATPGRFRRESTSAGAFLQPVAGSKARVETAVLNALLDGNGQFLSRFLPLWDDTATELVREHLRETLPTGATELRPVQGFNANVHPALLEREFAIDGVTSPLGATLLGPDELTVVHDIQSDLLILEDPTGSRVDPRYLGFLVPYYLPWELTGLYLLSRPTQYRLDMAAELERRLPPETKDGIRHYPRVRYRSLVLGRERWYVPAELMPQQAASESLAEWLVRLDTWRAQHCIPERVFVARLQGDPKADSALGPADAQGRPKPMYVDLRSPLHARCLAAWTRGAPTLRIDEALPDPAGVPVADPHVGRSAVEYLIECFRHERDPR
ncbi:lantibiotic dehydratase [Streptomyces sp. NPDC046900]|uniref:lantibiotic dehydratase n=1 Tax=Streptomyces sp. NPDC046900 TaxID=3155473 RepID=UPI0033E1A583